MNQVVKSTKALSREKWLELAMEAMTHECHSKFSLDSLIKAMPVSKGSFYWHFKNRSEFLEALVGYWGRHDTDNVIGALQGLPESAPAETMLWEMMCEIYEFRRTRHELLVRSLALEFPKLKSVIDEVDRKRLNQVSQIFAGMGFEGDELEMRTRLFVIVMSFDKIISPLDDERAYERELKRRHEFFIKS